MERNVEIIQDVNGKWLVMIKEILFKGRQKIQWDKVEVYAKRYVGRYIEVAETRDTICTDNGEILRYNIFQAELIVRHSANGKMYLYDIINIKKKRVPRFSTRLYGKKLVSLKRII